MRELLCNVKKKGEGGIVLYLHKQIEGPSLYDEGLSFCPY